MQAITLYRPWPFAIFRLGKAVENRTWAPPQRLLRPGDPLAIHAGKGQDGTEFIERIIGLKARTALKDPALNAEGIIGLCVFRGTVTESDDPWFVGQIGWKLSDPIEFRRPIATPGKQGLWTVPDRVVGVMQRQALLHRPLFDWAKKFKAWSEPDGSNQAQEQTPSG